MGKAFIKGLSHSTNHNIYLAEPNVERKNELKNDFDINISNSENQIKDFLSLSDIIILCVKPQTLKLLQDDLKNKISEKQTVLSIMAGISTEKLCSSLNIETILESLGDHIKVDNEDIIDKATAISGSGPGYIYYFMEAMKRSCKEIGMDDNLSNHLIVKTFLGSAILADFSKKEFSDLKKEVASPNGTTQAALNMMKNNNFEETIISGIKAAYNRAKELNND